MTAVDRLLAAIRGLVREEAPRATFLGVYEYLVQRATTATIDATPALTLGLPTITGAPLASPLTGSTVAPASTGQTCRVRFVNGDPSRPVVVGLGAPGADATVDAADALRLGPGAARVVLAGGSRELARDGDAVTIFLRPGVLVGVLTPPGGAPGTVGTLTVLSAVSGIITSTSRARA